MDRIEIERLWHVSNTLPIHGIIRLNGIPYGVTLERDDLEILPGTYHGRVYASPRFRRDVIRLEDANGRTNIEIHPGNSIEDTRGCILIGMKRSGHRILHSRQALDRLIKALETPRNIIVTVR
ncbi:DUF5675 family protein [Hahella sp. SMD15-11]|uniref:DUF5675 family protein n=1 Tax=Thermohahella caldifontis TaxID=3142973 RepID=A0AB39UT41_9GAMM